MPGLAPPPTPSPTPARPAPPAGVRDLLGELLADQRSLSAVDLFSRWHDRHRPSPAAPPSHRYQRLLPASPPAPGQQYAFEVHLDLCSGCKACVTACHSLNGLEAAESWRSVGLLVPPASAPSHAGPVHVTTACHHCADPACLEGCPVLAYDKDPRTGIVRHLDDQCIGCSYCTMTCPYEVPRYSPRLGIVRKCDLCQGRLAVGEAPACAQACPNDAIRITVTDPRSVTPAFPPSCPDPGLTTPATRYVSAQPIPAHLEPALATPTPAPAHTPLVVMLVLTQWANGILAAEAALRAGAPEHSLNGTPATLAALLAAAGLAASTLHLGQPTKAWKAWLGWRRSWLSREILVFGAFLPLAILHALIATDVLSTSTHPRLSSATATTAALTGLAGVLASSMVYVATRRRFWSAPSTFTRFLGTTLLGATTTLALVHPTPTAAFTLAALAVAKPILELALFRSRAARDSTEWRRSRHLFDGPLAPRVRVRLLLASVGAGLAIAAVVGIAPPLLLSAAALSLAWGEIIERSLYFRGVAPDSMPAPA